MSRSAARAAAAGRSAVRRAAVTAALAGLLLAACGTTAQPPQAERSQPQPQSQPSQQRTPDAQREAGPVQLEPVKQGPYEQVHSALDDPEDPVFPEPLVDPDRILSGGPPPDGIPAIDEPLFLPARDVDFLDEDEAVLALSVGGEARAYPVRILIWHEIVNDTVAGTPVSVTYCPLCNSALAFDRRVAGRLVTFGTSGMLYLSDLVMYDRQTESLWSQLEGRAIAGALTGERLRRLPVATVTWADWLKANPDGWVLSQQTGYDRDYGSNPYVGYDEADSEPTLFDGELDARLPPKERVIALDLGGDAVAVRLAHAAEQRVLPVEVGGRDVVVFTAPGLASSLDSPEVAEGREIAATGVFEPRAGGRTLTFQARGERFVDQQTGSGWNLFGEAVSGPLRGAQLRPVEAVDTFWFAWAAFKPDTRIVG